MEFDTTYEWLRSSLEPAKSNTYFNHNGVTWTHVAGFRRCGSSLDIYKNDTKFCAHAGDDWKQNDQPLFGYFSANLSYDELLVQLAAKYDELRSSCRRQ